MRKWNLKRVVYNMSILSTTFIVSQVANASLDMSPRLAVEYESPSGAKVKAFPFLGQCITWRYIPTRLFVRGQFAHDTVNVQTSPNRGIGIINNFEFHGDSKLSYDDIAKLKQKIFEFASTSPDCMSTEEKRGLPDGPRATAVIRPKNVNSVLLSAGDVLVTDVPANPTRLHKNYLELFSEVATANDDASGSRSITIQNDATDPMSLSRVKKLLFRSSQSPLGYLSFTMNGTIASMDAWIRIKSEMKLKFESILRKQCSDFTERGSDGAIAIGYLAAGVVGAGLSSMLEHKKTECTDVMYTFFKGGDISGIFENNIDEIDDKDSEGEPIMVETCNDKGVCAEPIPLRTYAKVELVAAYISSGFMKAIERGTEAAFEKDLGKNGDINTKFNFITVKRRAVFGRQVFRVAVIPENLNPASISNRPSENPLLSCAQSHYNDQILNPAFTDLLGTGPMPIHQACLKGN